MTSRLTAAKSDLGGSSLTVSTTFNELDGRGSKAQEQGWAYECCKGKGANINSVTDYLSVCLRKCCLWSSLYTRWVENTCDNYVVIWVGFWSRKGVCSAWSSITATQVQWRVLMASQITMPIRIDQWVNASVVVAVVVVNHYAYSWREYKQSCWLRR